MMHEFDDRQAASEAAAEFIAAALKRRLETDGQTAIVVSGGTTPVATFKCLSRVPLDWGAVSVVPSDERWVPPQHDDSNDKLVREGLLVDQASGATFVPLYADGISVEEHVPELEERLAALPAPFACSLLGMGADGHFASLFPDTESLATGLDGDSGARCIPVHTAASPHPRMSLTLPALLDSDSIVLLVFGDDKKAVLEDARTDDNAYPVSRLLRQDDTPVEIFWAP